jgi:hypothetical protein
MSTSARDVWESLVRLVFAIAYEWSTSVELRAQRVRIWLGEMAHRKRLDK